VPISSVIIKFAGLMSRWITPCSCACARPAAICRANASACADGIGPLSMRARTVVPATYSMTRYGVFSHTPKSTIDTQFGWASLLATRVSRSNRAWNSLSFAYEACRNLIATTLPTGTRSAL
jgi:hypothetical protein